MIYRFEDYELDTAVLELRRDGEPIHIEPQVFGVLAHLIEHRDRVVTKIELLDEVWLDRFVSESALSSRIQAARRACGDSGREQRIIQTRHGRGYRFVAAVEEIDPDRRPPSAPAEVPSAPAPITRPASALGIAGRREELDELDRALMSALERRRGTWLVSGGAGMGKSTLIDSALERCEVTDLVVLRAQARSSSGAAEPYVSLLEALGRLGREHGNTIVELIARVAPMWLMQLPSLLDDDRLEALERRTIGGTHQRMLREGVDLLNELGSSMPLVLVFEDLHWADDKTLEVLEWTASNPADIGPTTIAAFRPGIGETTPVDEMVRRLSGRGDVCSIQLAPLDHGAIRTLALEQLEAVSIDDDVTETLTVLSGGSPLAAKEQLLLWSADERIVKEDGRVRALDGDSLGEALPRSVRALVEAGLDRLSPEHLKLLEAAAVIGRAFPAFAVAAALDRPVDDVERHLAELARNADLVTATGDELWADGTVSTIFRLDHDIHHQILYDRIPASRRASMHQRVGKRLEAAFAHRRAEHLSELVRHFVSAGDSATAVTYLRMTGEQALARSAHREAVLALEHALDLLANLTRDGERDAEELRIRATLGPALVATSGWADKEIDENYERAMVLAGSIESPERFMVRLGLATVHELRGEYNRSEALLREQLEDGTDLRVEAHELLACSLFHQGSFADSLDHVGAALESWDQVADSEYMARYGEHPGVSVNTWGALSAWFLGQADLALEMAQRAVDWGARNEYALSTARVQFAFLHQHRGDPESCRPWAQLTEEIAGLQGFEFRVAQARVLMAWADARVAPAGSAPAELLEAVDAYLEFGARMDEPYFRGLVADVCLLGGDPEAALAQLDLAAETIQRTTRSFFSEPELMRLRAEAMATIHGADRASPLLHDAADLARRSGAVPHALRVALAFLRLDIDADRWIGELRQLAGSYPDSTRFPDLDRARELLTR